MSNTHQIDLTKKYKLREGDGIWEVIRVYKDPIQRSNTYPIVAEVLNKLTGGLTEEFFYTPDGYYFASRCNDRHDLILDEEESIATPIATPDDGVDQYEVWISPQGFVTSEHPLMDIESMKKDGWVKQSLFAKKDSLPPEAGKEDDRYFDLVKLPKGIPAPPEGWAYCGTGGQDSDIHEACKKNKLSEFYGCHDPEIDNAWDFEARFTGSDEDYHYCVRIGGELYKTLKELIELPF